MPTLTQNMVIEAAALLPTLVWSGMTDDGKEDPFMKKFPLADRDTWLIKVDQKGSPYGLMPQGTLGGPPTLMTLPGIRVYEYEPGVYRGYTMIMEPELTRSREPGTLADPLVVANRLSDAMLYIGEFITNRIKKCYADLGLYGFFNNQDTQGNQHTYKIAGYNRTGVSAWISSPLTATPIDDLRAVATAANRGTSTRFGQKSTILMSDEGISALLATKQIRDSFRSSYGASFLAPFDNAQKTGVQPPINGDQSLNKLMFGMGLPEITPWNEGYYPALSDVQTTTGVDVKANFVKFLPATALVWLGDRPQNQQFGQFTFCRHAGLLENGSAADYDSVAIKQPESVKGWGKNIYINVHYHNEQPHSYKIEWGINCTPEVWYQDCMLSVYWS